MGRDTSWYQMAAEQGNAGAQNNLGAMHLEGQGVARDYKAALSWLRKAAEQSGTGGAGLAQVNLGRMYAKGRGVPQDYVTAHMWFSLAAARGVEKAMKDREIVTAQMTPAHRRSAEACWRTEAGVIILPVRGFRPPAPPARRRLQHSPHRDH
jgi:uncharacterized protein